MGRNSREYKDADNQIKRLKSEINDFTYSSFDDAAGLGIKNPFADVTNAAANQTNAFADLQVNTQQAEFQRDSNDRSQANVLDALVQGGGNAAANATALASQATDANAQISADIGAQEAGNQRLSAEGEQARQQAYSQGEATKQQLQGQGNQYVSDLLQARDATRLEGLYLNQGQEYARSAAAHDRQQSQVNTTIDAAAQVASAAINKIPFSDRRLKEDISIVGQSDNGINIYEFKYKDQEGTYQGVMSDDIPEEAVVSNHLDSGYDGVDYSKIDVEFTQIK